MIRLMCNILRRGWRALAVSVACACVATAPGRAGAQSFPDKPIRLLVPYSAGGGADSNARVMAQPMSAILGQPIVVENRPGASGAVAVSPVREGKLGSVTQTCQEQAGGGAAAAS